jgi:hypothetical protein
MIQPCHENPFIVQNTHFTNVVYMTDEGVEFKVVKIHKPENVNFILGQSHFIKTVKDIAEAVVGSVPGAKFCQAFSEASG